MPKKNPRRRWWMPVKGRTQTPQALVVNLFGGVNKTAVALKLTPSAITQWKDKGIPSDRYSALLKIFPQLKFDDLIPRQK